jgi:hypothetical protein
MSDPVTQKVASEEDREGSAAFVLDDESTSPQSLKSKSTTQTQDRIGANFTAGSKCPFPGKLIVQTKKK